MFRPFCWAIFRSTRYIRRMNYTVLVIKYNLKFNEISFLFNIQQYYCLVKMDITQLTILYKCSIQIMHLRIK